MDDRGPNVNTLCVSVPQLGSINPGEGGGAREGPEREREPHSRNHQASSAVVDLFSLSLSVQCADSYTRG